jgi:hypothetical protein
MNLETKMPTKKDWSNSEWRNSVYDTGYVFPSPNEGYWSVKREERKKYDEQVLN